MSCASLPPVPLCPRVIPSGRGRVSYNLVPYVSPVGPTQPRTLRVSALYTSGATRYLSGQFRDIPAAEHFIARFYPDLIGRRAASAVS
jgi:hypothetical protein